MDKVTEICRVFLVDISMRKSLEDQLVQSQKMQAIGRLVAEIAHDFNNLLAAMRLYTDTLLGRHPVGDPSYPELQQINANVNRAAELVKKLLAYSRKQTIRAVKLDVSETLSDIAVTLKQVLGERVNLETVYGRDLPPVKVDKNQLETVLMNLAVNARDAMKEQGGGKITIKSEGLKRRDIEGTALRAALTGLKGDEFVQVSVADTGTGITDEIKSKIFEPFFTTKAQGKGTGLGLATVYGIVQQSGGHLAVESELGVGTTFTVYLPAYDGPDDADAAHAQSQSRKPRPPSNLAGQGNILFVEDEDSVRVIAAKTLRKRGYNVIEACDGEEAYEILQDGEESFDLMISDVVMPGMDGPTLLKKARTELGDARIVFISGYAEEEFSELLSEEPDVTFLPKPFSLVELAEKVKAEIGAG
jgi:two-component system cell cycle sensor histidine kinase/response regulator CckA